MGTYNLRGRKTTSKTKTYDLRPKKSVTQTLPSAKGESVSSEGGSSIRREDYKTEEAYARAKRQSELATKYSGLSYDQVQSEKSKYAQGTTEYDFFDQYTGYSSLADFDKAISAMPDERKDKLQIARNQYALDHASEAYKYLEENEDFEEKSQYVSTVNPDDAWWQDTSDRTYEFINDADGARDSIILAWDKTQTDSTIRSAHPLVQKGLAYMNEDEVKYYNYLYATEGKDKANEFLDAIEVMLTKRATDEQAKGISDAVDGDPLSSIALSAVSIPMNVVGAPLSLADSISGNPYGYYSQMSNASSAIRQSVGDNIEEGTDWRIGNTNVARFLYDTGMSIGDSAVGAVSFGHALSPIMGMSAYQQKAKELKEAGENEDVIVKTALASGVAEALFEYISVDKLLKIKNVDGWRKAVSETVKQMGIEGSEEVFTEIANVLADDFFRGGNSEIAQMRDDLKAKGFSDSEIATEIAKYVGGKVVQAGIGGALSGGVMGGVQSARQYSGLKSTGAEIRSNNRTSDMLTLAEMTPEESEAYKTYTEYAGKGINADNISDAQLGNLHALVEEDAHRTLDSKKTKSDEAMDAIARLSNLSQMETVLTDEERSTREKAEEEMAKRKAEAEARTPEMNITDLQAYAEGMSEEKAELLIAQYDGKTNVQDYIDSFELAYSYGESGFGAENVLRNKGVLTEAQASEIYKSAVKGKVKALQINVDNITAKYNGGEFVEGSLDDSIVSYDNKAKEGQVNYKDLTSTQRRAVKFMSAFAKATGVKINLVKSEVVDGKYNGKNGSYNPETNTIDIDIYAGRMTVGDTKNAIISTLSHELTHWMKAKSPALYSTIQEIAMNNLAKTGIAEGYVKAEVQRLDKAHGKGHTEADAIDEIVARYCEDMLGNSKSMRALLRSMTTEEATGFVEKAKAYIGNLIDWADELLNTYPSKSEEAKMLREFRDEFEKMSEAWDKALEDAIKANQSLQKEGITGEEVLANVGLAIDSETQSVYPTEQFSERTWTQSEYVTNREEAIEQLATTLGISKKKAGQYIDNVNSIARMIADDRARLDYIPSEGRSAFVSNVEYGGSIDFSTLCKKRRLYTGTISAVQEALPNTALTPEEYLKIRSMLLEKGYEATCGLCYVEGSRTMMGQYTKQFLEKYAKTNPPYVPTMAEMNTPEGQERIRFEHPEVYEKYVYFMNHYGRIDENDKAIFASQQKPKMYTLRTDYKHEIADKFKKASKVNEKNQNGGIRLQSFSDFEIVHLIDCMQVIMDMSKVGLAGQAYTKVVEFADALGNTGLKINLSLIAKGVDANGNLIFDDVEGMPHEEAMRLRSKYSKNVGTVVVVFNREQLASALRNPNIDYVLPFHRSQWKKAQYDMIGLPQDTEDFTNYQNEKGAKGNLMPNTYWNFKKSGRQNAEKYLSLCNESGRTPKFSFLLEKNADGTYSLPSGEIGDNYFKLLIDFKMYDNDGKGSPQLPVVPNFSMEESIKMLDEYAGGHSKFPVAQDVVDDFVAEYKKENPRKQYSDREEAYHIDDNGTVVIDEVNHTGNSVRRRYKKEVKQIVEDALMELYGQSVTIFSDSRNVFFDDSTATEFVGSEYTYGMRNKVKTAKMNMAIALKKVVETATKPKWAKNTKPKHEVDAKRGWTYYEIRFGISSQDLIDYYTARLVVRMDANGKDYVYEVDDVEFDMSVSTKKEAEHPDNADNRSTSNPTLTQGSKEVKKQYSDRDVTPLTEEDYKALQSHFGTTGNFNVAGYMLPNGKLLDFSGKHWGDTTSRTRQVDHRDVFEVIPDSNNGFDSMVRMISNGNIRLMPESGGINLAVAPTKNQRTLLRGYIEFMNRYNGEGIALDIDEVGGDTIKSFTYEAGTSADRVLEDIDRHFKGGSQSELMRFHTQYSDRDYSVSGKTASFTSERIDRVIKEFGASDQKYAQAYVTSISPRDFLKLTLRDEMFEKWNKSVEEGTNLDEMYPLDEETLRGNTQTPFLTIDSKTGEVIGHEGRHRMRALWEAGVTSVPIVLIDYKTKYSKQKTPSMRLTSQDFGYDPVNDGFSTEVTNLIPTNKVYRADIEASYGGDADIQYSDRETTSLFDVLGENKRLEKENAKLSEDIARLTERLALERKVTNGNTFNANQLRAVAKHLRSLANTEYAEDMLVDDLKDIYTYIVTTPDLQWDVLMDKCYDVASRMMRKQKPTKITNDYFKQVLRDIRQTKVSLSDVQISEAKSAYGDNFRNAFFGRVTLVKEGTSLDKQWQEWASKYPEIFDAEVNEADQILELSSILDSLKEGSEMYQTFNDTEMVRELAVEIYNQYWNVSTIRTTADKYDSQIKRLNFEHRKMMGEMRADFKQRVEDQKTADAVHYGKIIHQLRNQRDERVKEAKELGRKRMSEHRDRVARNAEIQKITKKALTLNEWLVKNSKDEHIPEVMKEPVAYFLSAIDFSSKQLLGMSGGARANTPTKKDISLSKALEKVHAMVQGINSVQIGEDTITEVYGTFADFPMGFEDDVRALSSATNDIMRAVGDNAYVLNEMSLAQLEELNRIITTLKSTVTKMNKFLAVRHAEGVANLSQQDIVYLDSLGKGKVHDKLRGDIDKMVNWGNATPYYAFKRLGDGAKKVYEAMQDGWDKFAFHIKSIIDFAEQTYTEKEIKEWSEDVKTFKILVPASDVEKASPDYEPEYQEVQMSVPQIMSLYCLAKREQARGHLFGGGIRIADITTKKGVVAQSEGAVLTESELATITGTLTSRQREVADALQRFMNTTCSDWGNEVSMIRFGIKQFGEENYFPIQSDKNNLAVNDETEQNNSLFRLLNMSFTKSITQKANNRLVISDIFDVFAQHASDMAKYNAMALPVLDAFKWYNYKEKVKKGDEGNFDTKSLKQSLENAFGKDAQNYLVTFFKDLNGAESGGRSSVGGGFFSSAKIASVGFNARVMFLQPTSYVRASALIDPKYMAMAFTRKPNIQTAEQYCGIALWKSLGFYDINIQRGVTDLVRHDGNVKDKIVDASMKGAEAADKVTWGYLWNACEFEVRDKNPDLVGEELYEKVAKRLREVIYSTQVVDSTMTRSHMMRSKDGYDKMATAFMSEPTLSYNMLQDTYYDWKLTERQTGSKSKALKKCGKKMARVFTAYTVTNLLCALVESGFDILRDSDDEEITYEDFMELFMKNFMVDMSILNKIPYAKEFVSLLQGYSSSRTDTQWLQYFAKTGKDLAKLVDGSGNAYTTAKDALRFFSYATGLPFYNIHRDLSALLDKTEFMELEEQEEIINELFNDTIGEIYPSLKIKE